MSNEKLLAIVKDQILLSHGRPGPVDSREFYVPLTNWITNTADGLPGYPLVYPTGYVPTMPAPADDFLSKVSVKCTVDDRKTYLFPGADFATLTSFGDFFPGGGIPDEAVIVHLLPRLHPVVVGNYVVRIDWVLTAEHRDGLSYDRASSCLPAGESQVDVRDFEVVPSAAPGR